MKNTSREKIEAFDKKIYEAFGHSWACDKTMDKCMCEGGTFYWKIVRPQLLALLTSEVEKAKAEVLKEVEEKVIGKDEGIEWNMGKDESKKNLYNSARNDLREEQRKALTGMKEEGNKD